MSTPAFSVRLGEPLRALLDRVAAAEDGARALRALLILGAAHAGLDVRAFRREMAALMESALAPEICAALQNVYDRCTTPVIHNAPVDLPVATEHSAADPAESDDPFANIGIAV